MGRLKTRSEADADLEEALKETFPASDPLSANVTDSKPLAPVTRRPPALDAALVERMARRVGRKVGARERKAR